MRTVPLLVLAALLTGGPSYAQGDIRDTAIALVAISPSYAYQVPGGALADRFGANSHIGLSAYRKFRSNYFIGAEGGFLFGNKVHEPGLLRHVVNSMGQIVDKDGVMADVQVLQRGYAIMGIAGKIMPVAGPNPNSGIMLKLGAGYLRHKIRIQTQENVVPNLEGDYLEGYDRLCAGPVGLFFVGYQHFGNRRRVNFFGGFEIMLGSTAPLRAFNFDTGRAETGRRLDMLSALRAGWTVPIHKRYDDRFHLY
ncbi:MAG: hypothetical protein RBT71_04015 [Flavobacteriales bacterium]|jgi:hypothetical protein|nr:hypothetical protein [Flavobacteriales bacterium]